MFFYQDRCKPDVLRLVRPITTETQSFSSRTVVVGSLVVSVTRGHDLSNEKL